MQGHVRKRRTWEFIVDIGPHPVTGRRRQKSKSGFDTKREAESALHEFIQLPRRRGRSQPRAHRAAHYLRGWLEYQRARGIRSRTLDGYEGYIRREIVPVIGGLELAKLRPSHIRAGLARMQQRGLSASTVAQVRSVLGSALRQAVADGLIAANPVAAVKRPRVQRRDASEAAAALEASLGASPPLSGVGNPLAREGFGRHPARRRISKSLVRAVGRTGYYANHAEADAVEAPPLTI